MTSQPAQGTSTTTRALMLGALGVVFGDIGTSPLYTVRECAQRLPQIGEAAVFGVLSLVFWSLILVVSLKYVLFVLRADNKGEGGIFALLALADGEDDQGRPRTMTRQGFSVAAVIILGGAALLYGDGVITPAISVLSAAEGFKSFHPSFHHYTPHIACAILFALFLLQRQGTGHLGKVFGPVMVVWFGTLGALGLWHIQEHPRILMSINPQYGWELLFTYPGSALAILGSVFLAVTGAEGMYADMGHFGRRAIRLAWYTIGLPGLWLNYLGQGAHVIANPLDAPNLFYALAPEGWARLALVILSIIATVIASQALIAGVFSLTRQAIQLGFFPRLTILHTNPNQEGQIYLPLVNWSLAAGSIFTVIFFQTSDKLASAYGVAVSGCATITTIGLLIVMRKRWRWSIGRVALFAGLFLVVDLTFLSANLTKVFEGGWFPIVIGVAVLTVMRTWKRGRDAISAKVYGAGSVDIELPSIARSSHVHRVGGCGVFMSATPRGTPLALLHHIKANRVLQKTAVLLTVQTENSPTIPEHSRVGIEECGEGVWRIVARYGYMESPDVASIVDRLRKEGLPIEPMHTTYFFNREIILTDGNTRLWEWEKRLYAFLTRNARPARDYYRIPPSQIIELSLPVQL
jgi:KUP system potassium uptake protein